MAEKEKNIINICCNCKNRIKVKFIKRTCFLERLKEEPFFTIYCKLGIPIMHTLEGEGVKSCEGYELLERKEGVDRSEM